MKSGMTHLIGATAVAVGLAFGGVSSAQAADDPIVFGWTAWADAEFVTKTAQQLIEEHTDHTVELKMSAIGVQFQAVADGDLDGMLMAWLPDTHASYWERFQDDVVDLGTIYGGAKLGWAVPSYVSEDKVSSIDDLKKPEVIEMFGGKIQGIDPGAGLMQLSEKTIDAYKLGDDYNLINASGAAMTAALARAEDRKEPIIVTAWTPHWMFGKWDLRFLKDSKGTLGEAQHIDAVVRKGFKEDYPKVANFLSNYHYKLDELQTAMYNAQNTSYEQAVKEYIDSHPDQIKKWFAEG